MSSQSTRGRAVSHSEPVSLDDVSTSTRFHSSLGAKGNNSGYNTDEATRHDVSPVESSAESAFDPRDKASTGGSLACLIGMVIALVTQILLAVACTCVLLLFDWQPHAPEDTALGITIAEWGIVGLIAIMFCDHSSIFFYVALIVLFVVVPTAEASLALGLYFESTENCASFACELLRAEKLQRYVLWAMLAGSCCAHVIVLVAVIAAKIVDCRRKRTAENASGRSARPFDSYKTTPDNSAATATTVRSRSVYDDGNRTYAGGHLHCCSKASLALSSLPTAADAESINRKHEVTVNIPHVRIKIPPLSHASAYAWHDTHANNSAGTALQGGYAWEM